MEVVLYIITGSMVGCLVGCLMIIITLNIFKSKPSIDYKELTKQAEERLKMLKKHGEELDRMLEEIENYEQ